MNEGGQPGNTNALKYKDEESLQKGIDEYFKQCDEKDLPYTMTGLADTLDIDRSTLVRYGERESFAPLIKKAKRKVEKQLEERALSGKYNSTFSIFNLKVNYKWDDNQESSKEAPVVTINVVDNSSLEKAMYEEDKPEQVNE